MTAINQSAGCASDALFRIKLGGCRLVGHTSRELRREAERRARKAHRRQSIEQRKAGEGF